MDSPGINVDILIVQNGKVLLGLLSEKWLYEGKKVYGVPGRDILLNEAIEQTVQRNIHEEFGCEISSHEIICVNANRAFGNHYIGIGVVAKLSSEPQFKKSGDWDSWEWFPLDSIPENLFPAAKNAIECYRTKKICVSE